MMVKSIDMKKRLVIGISITITCEMFYGAENPMVTYFGLGRLKKSAGISLVMKG
jgi:hypothetical protein